eukprot:Gb_36741 [translate_table: standard]
MLATGVAASTSIPFASSMGYNVQQDAKISQRRIFSSLLGSKKTLKWSASIGGHGFSLATGLSLRTRRHKAEVSCLLDLIVHSLYSNKEVFLQELVSNASDALDKLYFLSVTEPSVLGDAGDLEIRIKSDKDNGTITIIDTDIEMTKELIDCLGTIAQSGTSKFLKALKENKDVGSDNNLIGHFGVGFYSAFLVAEKIEDAKNAEGEEERMIAPQEACNRIAEVVQEAVRKMEDVAEEKVDVFKKARLALDMCDRELEDKKRELAELQFERQWKKQ